MKNLNLMSAIALSILLFTACEKDRVTEPNFAASNQMNKVKHTNVNVKSVNTQEFSDFTEDLINDENPGTFESDTALLYLEAAMNYELNYVIESDDEFPIIQRAYYIDDLDYNAFESGSNVNGSDILDLETEIFDAIDGVASEAKDTIPGTGNLYVTSIDISFDEGSISDGVTLNFSLGRFGFFSSSVCSFDGDYFLQFDMGGCNDYGNAGVLTNIDANDIISAHIANPNCNPNIDYCPSTGGPFQTWFNVRTHFDRSGYSLATFNTLGNHYTTLIHDDCLSESTQSSVASSIETWQSNNFTGARKVKNALTENWGWTTGIPPSTVRNYAIKQSTYTAYCTNIIIISKPDIKFWSGD